MKHASTPSNLHHAALTKFSFTINLFDTQHCSDFHVAFNCSVCGWNYLKSSTLLITDKSIYEMRYFCVSVPKVCMGGSLLRV